ncbi:unnamed protein product [Allacma fusca]|uniref:Kazal-like domain-containing protein n=1 Tax=Allacma fusca TaxID=39272 RepID=A0A8J2PVQ6_9HEXA|nr:unnamed protein product [Allacma fusca]
MKIPLILGFLLIAALATTTVEAQRCGQPCATTYELQEICGTDGRTYGNRGSLACAQRCNRRLRIARYGRC